jgi:transcriptional regulator with XRE-family HTH domain
MQHEHTMKLHDLLKAERERQGMTVSEAAERAGIARTGWIRWESGEHVPRVSTLVAAARALGLRLRLETDGFGYDLFAEERTMHATQGKKGGSPRVRR